MIIFSLLWCGNFCIFRRILYLLLFLCLCFALVCLYLPLLCFALLGGQVWPLLLLLSLLVWRIWCLLLHLLLLASIWLWCLMLISRTLSLINLQPHTIWQINGLPWTYLYSHLLLLWVPLILLVLLLVLSRCLGLVVLLSHCVGDHIHSLSILSVEVSRL